MKYGTNNMPGYGDEVTWPACANHPNDPRTPDMSEDESWARYAIEDVQAMCGRIERALDSGDMDAAYDLLRSAGRELAAAERNWS